MPQDDIEMNRLGRRPRSITPSASMPSQASQASLPDSELPAWFHARTPRALEIRPDGTASPGLGSGEGDGSRSSSGRMRARMDRLIDSFRREDGSRLEGYGFDDEEHQLPDHQHHDSSHRPYRPPPPPDPYVYQDTYTDTDAGTQNHPEETLDENGHPIRVRKHALGRYYDLREANARAARTLLARELKGRHLQMIAISGSIGTGLFVASGKALSQGGPASLLLAYCIVGSMLWCTMQALGEMAVVFPVAGSFSMFSTRFLDPSWGFAMGWNYFLQMTVAFPLEVIAGSMTIGYWNPGLEKSIFVTVFLVVIVAINLMGVKGYGEAEFIFAIVKVTAVVGFILFGIVINIGGTPTSGYIGGTYWHSPGAFHNGFKGLCAVFVAAAFAFAGTELVGLAAAETANPRKSLPTAIKQVFWRISLFYIVSLALIGLLVPYTEPRLLGATSIADASASPFVIAIESAGTTVLPSIMNGVILVAVISVGNSSVFGASRTLAALAEQGHAPRIFRYIDRRGRPLLAILAVSAVGLLAFLAHYEDNDDIFDWLMAISGLSTMFTWASTCLAHIRLRKAWTARGRSTTEDMAFTAQAGVWGSWVGFVCNVVFLLAQLWVAIAPLPRVHIPGHGPGDHHDHGPGGHEHWNGNGLGHGHGGASTWRARNFFIKCLALPVVIVFYLGHKLWYRTGYVRVADMDIDTGRRDFGRLGVIKAQEAEERRTWPRWKRLYRMVC
ncbi:putative amino-acid permease [Dichotomopilus funicola]|uniref:Amino-acid permease n=1 Tax=Dichotomopilus funicola TaxID=1934379 RepID=A0AAN6UZ57_9PEZI|nr:putative amino-acid permease [Dichotomopilus funicola]